MFKCAPLYLFFWICVGCGVSFSAAAVSSAPSNRLAVITSGGFAAAYEKLSLLFVQQTGIQLDTSYGSSSGGAPDSIPVRLQNGQKFDVMILSKSSLNRLQKAGWVAPASRRDLVQSRIGMAIKAGSPKPDIRSPEAFVQTLLKAKSIGYSASASGTYLSTVLWPRMGIWQQIQAKSTRVLSKRVASVVAAGEVEIGFQQISEILPIEGADYVGPIPDKWQKVTVFSAGVLASSDNQETARQLIQFLNSKPAFPIIESVGLMPIPAIAPIENQESAKREEHLDKSI